MPKAKQQSYVEKKNSIIPRVTEVLQEISESTNGAKSNNYMGYGLKPMKNYANPSAGTIIDYMDYSEHGMPRYDPLINKNDQASFTSITASGGKMRKPRKDKGVKKMSSWYDYVSTVSKRYGLPYNKALKKASELKKAGVALEDL